MKKLMLISAILFIGIASSFAFNPTHTRVVVSVSGDNGQSQSVGIYLNCEVLVSLSCTTYGYAVASDSLNVTYLSGYAPGAYVSKQEMWASRFRTIITLSAYAAYGGPNAPQYANTAVLNW